MLLAFVCMVGSVHSTITMHEPTPWDPRYLNTFVEAVLDTDATLNKTDPNLLAMLWARTGEKKFGSAASTALRLTASETKPLWLARNKVWDAPSWYNFNLSNTTFQQPDRFSGCTDYGLLGYYILQTGGWSFQDWTRAEAERYKHMHETLCVQCTQ